MSDHRLLLERMHASGLGRWAEQLPQQLQTVWGRVHGDQNRWQAALDALPRVVTTQVRIVDGALSTEGQMEGAPRDALMELHPWRKGPYQLHGLPIDTEWRSDWKWERVAPHLQPLAGRRVLDVGCGNGYHGWRIALAGAELVIGIDPSKLFSMQFRAVRHFVGADRYPFHLLPLGIADVPAGLRAFDTVFSMGVLYHRRSPLDHLLELKDCLRPGGELVLESLVIEGPEGMTLLPRGRYAKMRNVFFIPTPETLCAWLRRCGFEDVRLVDLNRTNSDEQRTTDWMRFESLSDFLDPYDPRRTCEGYPAPLRAVIVARAG